MCTSAAAITSYFCIHYNCATISTTAICNPLTLTSTDIITKLMSIPLLYILFLLVFLCWPPPSTPSYHIRLFCFITCLTSLTIKSEVALRHSVKILSSMLLPFPPANSPHQHSHPLCPFYSNSSFTLPLVSTSLHVHAVSHLQWTVT